MKIVKKKKGKQYYYYLKHSYRENGKVITKETYLGKTIPKDLEKFKQKLKKRYDKELYRKLEAIKKSFQEEWKRYPQSAKEKYMQQIAIAFTYNTNAIEGSTITLSETRDIIEYKIAPHKPLGEIKETEAHAKLFLNILKKKEKITNKLILQWHNEIFKETKKDIAGRYRDYLVRVGPYLAPDWQEVKKMMNGLVKFLDRSKLNPLELAGRSHYIFEKIHPFGDGNGRIGRLIMNYILWHSGYPMLIIEYEKRESYYKALQKGEEGFLSYFIRRYLTAHRKRCLK